MIGTVFTSSVNGRQYKVARSEERIGCGRCAIRNVGVHPCDKHWAHLPEYDNNWFGMISCAHGFEMLTEVRTQATLLLENI